MPTYLLEFSRDDLSDTTPTWTSGPVKARVAGLAKAMVRKTPKIRIGKRLSLPNRLLG
jgi:hypothetical protein